MAANFTHYCVSCTSDRAQWRKRNAKHLNVSVSLFKNYLGLDTNLAILNDSEIIMKIELQWLK